MVAPSSSLYPEPRTGEMSRRASAEFGLRALGV